MAICKINLNQDRNGIELTFDHKPSAEVLAEVKAQGFRWSNANKLWYAKQTAERLEFAKNLGEVTEDNQPKKAPAKNVINLDNLGGEKSFYGSDLAKAIREDLKQRGVKGVTVRHHWSTHTDSITVTVKATAEDFASLEEAAERYNRSHFACDVQTRNGLYISSWNRYLEYTEYENMTEEEKDSAFYTYLSDQIKKTNGFSNYHHERKDCWTLTTDFYNKCVAVFKIANQWNYDHSDSMTDYFDIGYFLDIDIKTDDFEPRATMTEEERNGLEQERKEEQEAFEKWQKEAEEQRKKDEEAAKKHNEWVQESTEIIFNDIAIEDLEESEQLFVIDLVGGYGKENSLEELKEDAAESPHTTSALVTRKIVFKTQEALDRFNKMYLHDFPFIEGKGGTATEDIRLSSFEDYGKLTAEQRESIEMYCTDCIAVYYNNTLQLVIDPQGYGYSRYVYLADNSTVLNSKEQLDKQRSESENKTPFYFPEPVETQVNNIQIGDDITVWQCDGWILNKVLDGMGKVTNIRSGSYAQYEGVYIDLAYGKKQKSVFIRDNHTCLIYKGINCLLPDEVTRRKVSDSLYELYNHDVLIPNIYNYFKSQGLEPIVDTWQR